MTGPYNEGCDTDRGRRAADGPIGAPNAHARPPPRERSGPRTSSPPPAGVRSA